MAAVWLHKLIQHREAFAKRLLLYAASQKVEQVHRTCKGREEGWRAKDYKSRKISNVYCMWFNSHDICGLEAIREYLDQALVQWQKMAACENKNVEIAQRQNPQHTVHVQTFAG